MMQRSTLLSLAAALWLAGCASTGDEDLRKNAAEANFKLGIGYMQSGHFNVALEKLLKSLQYDENNPETHNAVALIYEEIREYGPAEAHYKRAIELRPDYTAAKINLAYFKCTREPLRLSEGESEFQQIAADPANAGANASEAYAGLATCAQKGNDPTQAETWARKAIEGNPNNIRALFALAQLSQSQGKTLQARAFLQRYHAQTRPTLQSLALGVAIESSKDGDTQLLREYTLLLKSQFPNSDEARRLKNP
ncbi:MAG TPA: tetratricopeptide repeat protein [Candidatus Competibacteraceae bacterium]|nr:MAG: tetratricopeptide repeat protein [Candidatus Competibacteraceae bacterium]HOB61010.1 tetratricopeptide repeat protein [Candidatus Competibacteraceae bacterium]HQA25838.1 tetratricopeptide repeat protein [Candidatus Competibacteraceae bacterium]HQD55853.1 tetratricopeptide repeat protein [Candidatus Competibacteraceae bacterium]